MRARVAFCLFLPVIGCAGAHGAREAPATSALRKVGVGSLVDPTVGRPRLVPLLSASGARDFGTEPGGGTRRMTGGLRVLEWPNGAVMVSESRLPQPPSSTTPLPDRLGGGFLFVLGTTIWRAERWLEPAKPIFTAGHAVQGVVAGLDRVYLRGPNGLHSALDAKTGRALDLGPWPATPHVGSYAAADGWRAAAVADLRGVVATFDAGATWRTIPVPMQPRHVIDVGDNLAIGGIDGSDELWFELHRDGSVAKLAERPSGANALRITSLSPSRRMPSPAVRPGTPPPPREAESESTPEASEPAIRTLGRRPLAAAVEDGWPLTDGTALVARDGALARVRLSDGSVVDFAAQAFSQKPARCHALSLTRKTAKGAFGFVCGEPRGSTVVYAYDPMAGSMRELRRFDRPRAVLSSGNGAIAVRGACAADADPAAQGGHAYCVLGHDNAWRDVVVRGDVGGERIVVLEDGRLAILSPPSGEAPPRLTLLDKGRATTVPIAFPTVSKEVGRVLRLGVWLDGFEERRPGVLGGWLEAGGVMLGVEIALDGKATVGQYVRDAGLPFVSGRYGLGWPSGGSRGFETIDGGMTWRPVDLAGALVSPSKVDRRACGPIGCIAAGWIRLGWGDGVETPVPATPPVHRSGTRYSSPALSLACDPVSPAAPAPPTPRVTVRPRPPPRITLHARAPAVLSPVVSGAPMNAAESLPPFSGQAAPQLKDERGISLDVHEPVEHFPRNTSLGRLYAWGPKSGWEMGVRWQVRWLWPFSGWTEAKSSLVTAAPQAALDLARMPGSYGYGYSYGSGALMMGAGDDPSHALLFMRRVGRSELTPFELEAERAPIEIRRADGEPFTEIDGTLRFAGHWFIATPPPAPLRSAMYTSVWRVDGSVARELATIPRAGLDGRPTGARLAHRSDGNALGLVVEGQGNADRSSPTRWVVSIDIESGQLGEPEPLGFSDLAAHTLQDGCGTEVGWVLDGPLPSRAARMRLPSGASGSLHSLTARVRLTEHTACIEDLAGTYGTQSAQGAAELSRRGGGAATGPMRVTAFANGARYQLACTLK
ncbi:MAG: hypothetical protein R3B36_33405 [Polyangiaceae bacterium]